MKSPEVTLKAAMSLNGCIDDSSPVRCVFSNAEDAKCVDELRAESDAILVGAGTIRSDNPQLMVRSGKLRRQRRLAGKEHDVKKVTMTISGNLRPDFQFFQRGRGEKIVYVASAGHLDAALYDVATIVMFEMGGEAGNEQFLRFLLDDLYNRGVRKLLVEGGASIITQFLRLQLASTLRLAIAPVFIGDSGATRLVDSAPAHESTHGLILRSVEQLGGVSVLTYRRG